MLAPFHGHVGEEIGSDGGAMVFELYGAEPVQCGVTASAVVDVSMYSKVALASSTRVRQRWRSSSSVCIRRSVVALWRWPANVRGSRIR